MSQMFTTCRSEDGFDKGWCVPKVSDAASEKMLPSFGSGPTFHTRGAAIQMPCETSNTNPFLFRYGFDAARPLEMYCFASAKQNSNSKAFFGDPAGSGGSLSRRHFPQLWGRRGRPAAD